jgi:hypothetical protein
MNTKSSLQLQLEALEGKLKKSEMLAHLESLENKLEEVTLKPSPPVLGPGAQLQLLQRQLDKIEEEEERLRQEEEMRRVAILLEQQRQYERQLAIENGLIALGNGVSGGYGVSCERCQLASSHTQGCDCFHCRTLSHTCGGRSAPTAWENNLTDDIGYGRGVRPDRSSRSGFSGGWQKK